MRSLLLLSVLLASCASTSNQGPQQNRYGTQKGENLVTIGGSLSRTMPDGNGDDTTTAILQAGFGRFLTDEHEVGAQVLVAKADAGGFDATINQIAPYYNYNFRQSARTWYYVGPHLGVIKVDTDADDDTSVSFGVHGGIRQWLTPSTSAFVEPRYTLSSDFDDFTILFGLNISLFN